MDDHRVAQLRTINGLKRKGKVFDPKPSTYLRILRWIHKVLDDDSTEPEVILQVIHVYTSMSELSVRAYAEAAKAYAAVEDQSLKRRSIELQERMFEAKQRLVDSAAGMPEGEHLDPSVISAEDGELLAELHGLARSGGRMSDDDWQEYGRLMAVLAAGKRTSEGPGGDGGRPPGTPPYT
jgi:hypothetical protein